MWTSGFSLRKPIMYMHYFWWLMANYKLEKSIFNLCAEVVNVSYILLLYCRLLLEGGTSILSMAAMPITHVYRIYSDQFNSM